MAADAGAAFPKTARVRRRAEFVEIKQGGARCHLPSFVVTP